MNQLLIPVLRFRWSDRPPFIQDILAVTVKGPAYVDIAVRKTADGKLSLHLLNRTNLPMPDRYDFTDFIPPIGPLAIEMDCPAKPKAVRFVQEREADGAEAIVFLV